MNLIINMPDGKDEEKEFNTNMAKLQTKLFLLEIEQLNLNLEQKKELLFELQKKVL